MLSGSTNICKQGFIQDFFLGGGGGGGGNICRCMQRVYACASAPASIEILDIFKDKNH